MTLITDDMKTEWYPPQTKPKHRGIYEIHWFTTRGVRTGNEFAYWNGCRWTNGSKRIESVVKSYFQGAIQAKYWRGLKAPHDGETS